MAFHVIQFRGNHAGNFKSTSHYALCLFKNSHHVIPPPFKNHQKKYRLINSQFRFKYQFYKFWHILTIINIQISMSRNFPTIPKLHHGSLYTPDSHGEGIDVFIQLIQQTNGLDDHVVYTMNIKLYFCSRVTVAQTQLCLGSHWTSQSLDHLLKMKSYSSEDL